MRISTATALMIWLCESLMFWCTFGGAYCTVQYMYVSTFMYFTMCIFSSNYSTSKVWQYGGLMVMASDS